MNCIMHEYHLAKRTQTKRILQKLKRFEKIFMTWKFDRENSAHFDSFWTTIRNNCLFWFTISVESEIIIREVTEYVC